MLLCRTLQPGEGRGPVGVVVGVVSVYQGLLGISEELAQRYEAQVMEDW